MSGGLLKDDGAFDKAAVMREAHKLFAQMRRLGEPWRFGRCLSYVWRKAKGQRAAAARVPVPTLTHFMLSPA